MEKKINYNFFLLLVILGVSGIIFMFFLQSKESINQRRIFHAEYKKFYESNIDGQLVYIEMSRKMTLFKVDNDSSYYYFAPRTEIINQKKKFLYTAELGDRIIKHAFKDTLQLIKNNKLLLYRFQKFK